MKNNLLKISSASCEAKTPLDSAQQNISTKLNAKTPFLL